MASKGSNILFSCLLLAIILICLSCGGGGGSQGAQAELIEDDLGRQVLIPHVPERIVSLSPATTENLFALGLGPRVVAGTEYDDYPPEA